MRPVLALLELPACPHLPPYLCFVTPDFAGYFQETSPPFAVSCAAIDWEPSYVHGVQSAWVRFQIMILYQLLSLSGSFRGAPYVRGNQTS